MKNLIILAMGLVLFYAVYVLSDYPKRIKEYNNYMCVEIYGLDENCQERR